MATERELDVMTAVGLAEGFIRPRTDNPDAEIVAAWQHLVDTGVVWQLQGWYGRTAAAMIENGVIEPPLSN